MDKGKVLDGAVRMAVVLALLVSGYAAYRVTYEAPEARLREKISVDARDDLYLYYGADLYMYSDDHVTQKVHIDGATGDVDSEGSWEGTGMTVTGDQEVTGTLTVNAVTVTGTLTAEQMTSTDDLTVADDGEVQGDLLANTGTITGALTAEQLTSTDDLTVTDDAEVQGDLLANSATVTGTVSAEQVTSTDDALVTDDLTVGGDAVVTGTHTAVGFLISGVQDVIPTDGSPFTPTQTIVSLTPAGEVTPTIAACSTNGTWLLLYNTAAQTINLADGGNFILTGALAMTQYDTLQLVCFSTKWVQASQLSAN